MAIQKMKLLKDCCWTMQRWVEKGVITLDAKEHTVRLANDDSKNDLYSCPSCGKHFEWETVLANPESIEKILENKFYSRDMTDFELKGLVQLYEYFSQKYADGKLPVDSVENLVDALGGPLGRKKFWLEFGHHVVKIESYSCLECDEYTNHYLDGKKAICSVCLTEQERDPSADGIVASYELFGHGNESKKKMATVTVEEVDYMDTKCYRVMLDISHAKFQVGDIYPDKKEAIDLAEDVSVE